MELFRLHAYTISPARTSKRSAAPSGGAVKITAQLRDILDETTAAANFGHRTLVDFEMPGPERTNEIRDLFLDFGFGSGSTARTAALATASKLAEAMDQRSTPCLLVLSGMRDELKRRVTIWTFPRDKAFRLQGSSAGASIQILTDIFSQTSRQQHLRGAE